MSNAMTFREYRNATATRAASLYERLCREWLKHGELTEDFRRDIAVLLCGTLGVAWVIAGIAVDAMLRERAAEPQDYAVESVPLAIAPVGAEAGGQPRPRQLLVVRVLRRPASDAALREVGHGVRQSLDAQGLRDVAAIVTADWLEVRVESLEGGR